MSAAAGDHAPTEARRIRLTDFARAKREGRRWAMLTSYDQYTASIFDGAGVWALLVGDSAANNVYGYDTTLPVTVDELLPLVRAVARSTRRAFVVGDLPFGSYEDGPSQALETSIRFMKEGGCHAVKFEGGVRVAEQIRKVTGAGIPVMAHIGFTPQSEHQLGGYRVQGRGVRGRAAAGRRPRRGRRRRVRGRHGDGAGRPRRAGDGRARHPHRGHRGRAGLRRPGPRLAGRDGPAAGHHGALREAVRADRPDPRAGGRHLRRGGGHRGLPGSRAHVHRRDAPARA